MLAESRDDPLPAIACQIMVDVVGAIRFDQQPRHDRVEYRVPWFTEARNLVDVMDAFVILVAEVQQFPQHVLLPACKRDALFSTNDGFPQQEAILFHPEDEAIDRFVEVVHVIQRTALEKILGRDV